MLASQTRLWPTGSDLFNPEALARDHRQSEGTSQDLTSPFARRTIDHNHLSSVYHESIANS
jgi:hypothetical protein